MGATPDETRGGCRLAIVVAVAQNGVIGRDNQLPWRLKTDLRRFKRLTMGKPMIMGRRSWDAVGRPLPGRESIVLTRDHGFAATGAHVVHTWEDARVLAAERAGALGSDTIIVFGGAEIYRLAFPDVDLIHMTVVEGRPDGDAVFPAFDAGAFRETFREAHPAGPEDEYPFVFVDLVRQR